eukprot:XP_011664586.1 PREDICTED: inhibitor of growth protein 3-like [Strongylocentrotus purpuratus]
MGSGSLHTTNKESGSPLLQMEVQRFVRTGGKRLKERGYQLFITPYFQFLYFRRKKGSSSLDLHKSSSSSTSQQQQQQTQQQTQLQQQQQGVELTPLTEPLTEQPAEDTTTTYDWTFDPNEPRYCLCNQVSYGEMVGCDNPKCPIEWFHYGCVGITNPPKGKWFCPQCASAMKRREKKDTPSSSSSSSSHKQK